MNENSNKTFDKKKLKSNHTFRIVTTNNDKHFFRFPIKQYWQFQGVIAKKYCTFFKSSYQIVFTLPEIYHQKRVNTLSKFKSNITDNELLANNTAQFSRAYIKQ